MPSEKIQIKTSIQHILTALQEDWNAPLTENDVHHPWHGEKEEVVKIGVFCTNGCRDFHLKPQEEQRVQPCCFFIKALHSDAVQQVIADFEHSFQVCYSLGTYNLPGISTEEYIAGHALYVEKRHCTNKPAELATSSTPKPDDVGGK